MHIYVDYVRKMHDHPASAINKGQWGTKMAQLRAMVLMAGATYVAASLVLVGLLVASQVLAPDLFQPAPPAAVLMAGGAQ